MKGVGLKNSTKHLPYLGNGERYGQSYY